MHLPLAHRNSSFSHVGTVGGAAVDITKHTHTISLIKVKERGVSQRSKGLHNLRQFSSSELSPQLLTPSHLFNTFRHTRSFWQRKALVGGHWNFPKSRTEKEDKRDKDGRGKKMGQDKRRRLTDIKRVCDSQGCTHCTLQDSRQSCPHSRPPRHTSRRGVYTKCCCTGTHPEGSDAQLKKTGRNRKRLVYYWCGLHKIR